MPSCAGIPEKFRQVRQIGAIQQITCLEISSLMSSATQLYRSTRISIDAFTTPTNAPLQAQTG